MNRRAFKVWSLVLCLAWGVSSSAQQHIHLLGTMPTLDVGMSLGEDWYVETYSFACILPFEQSRPSFSNAAVMENYGPGNQPGESRGVRALVFAYTEWDVTRTLNEAWSLTGSYTHEWVPSNASVWGEDRYTRDEHRVWLQSKYQGDLGSAQWWWRMRWDQRWIESDPYGEGDRWMSRPRLREQLGCTLPLGGGTLSASTEVFIEAWKGANATQGLDRFREAWTTLQFGKSVNDNLRWEAGPLVVSWKQMGEAGSLGWAHYWYLQATAFVNLSR